MRKGFLLCRHHVAAIVGGHCVRKGFGGLCVKWFTCCFTFGLAKCTMALLVLRRACGYFVRVGCFQLLMAFPVLFVILKNLSSFASLLYMPVNARTVTHKFQKWIFYHRIFRLFGGATEGLKICGRFVGSMIFVYSCRRLVFEAWRILTQKSLRPSLYTQGCFSLGGS